MVTARKQIGCKLNAELWMQIKILALKKGITSGEMLEMAMKEYLELKDWTARMTISTKKIINIELHEEPPLCECGCREKVILGTNGRWNRFIPGHHAHGKRGPNSPNWKGGIADYEKMKSLAKKRDIPIGKLKERLRQMALSTITQTTKEVEQCRQLQNILS